MWPSLRNENDTRTQILRELTAKSTQPSPSIPLPEVLTQVSSIEPTSQPRSPMAGVFSAPRAVNDYPAAQLPEPILPAPLRDLTDDPLSRELARIEAQSNQQAQKPILIRRDGARNLLAPKGMFPKVTMISQIKNPESSNALKGEHLKGVFIKSGHSIHEEIATGRKQPYATARSEKTPYNEALRNIRFGAPWYHDAHKSLLLSEDVDRLMEFAVTEYAAQEVINGRPYDDVAKKYELSAQYYNLLEMISAKVIVDKYLNEKQAPVRKDIYPFFSINVADLIMDITSGRGVKDNAAADQKMAAKYQQEIFRVMNGEKCQDVAKKFEDSQQRAELELQVAKQVIAKDIHNGVPFARAVIDAGISFRGDAMAWLMENVPLKPVKAAV